MTDTEAVQTLGLVRKLWPATAKSWAPELDTEFMVACSRIRIDWDQAEAAIKNLAMEVKYQSVKPVDCLNALRNAVARVVEVRRQSSSNTLQADLEAATTARLLHLPEHLRHEAILRIDGNLPPPESRGSLADNLANAARMAEDGDWSGALLWPLFRYEVKTTPAVKVWLGSER